MQQGKGYWVRNNKIVDISATTHIGYIIDNPEYFNITLDFINLIYHRYNEKLGVEGKAREEIIKKVSSDGWIRVRHYFKPKDYWSIQFDQFILRQVSIKSFLEWAVHEGKVMYRNEELILLGYENNKQMSYPYTNGGVQVFLDETKELETLKMTLL
jgi:hypothetical protein